MGYILMFTEGNEFTQIIKLIIELNKLSSSWLALYRGHKIIIYQSNGCFKNVKITQKLICKFRA